MKLLHFTAEWCGPCRMMKPIINDIVADRNDLEYVAIDIDTNPETAQDYGVLGIPAFFLLDDNDNVLSSASGALPKQKFLDALGI